MPTGNSIPGPEETMMDAIQIGGTRVEYCEQGSGEPVLLLHCSGSSGAQWRALIERLSDRFRVVAPDLYGCGGSAPWPGRGPFHLAHEAEIASALLGRIGEPAHVVGHSYGGATALHLARLRGDLLRSLAVIEPVAFHLLRGGDETDALALREISAVAATVADSLACGDYQGGLGRFTDYWSGAGAWDALPAAKRDTLAARLVKVALDFHATLNEPARLNDFRMLALPTLVLRGSRSPLPTRRICELLARALPEACMKTIDGAGHMAPLTHRDEVNDLIVAHLDANRALRRTGAVLEVA
jgi:pimeloyl-ACP methyl ester carboxylesterase